MIKTVSSLLLFIAIFLQSVIADQLVNCEQPLDSLEEQICTTRSIISLYQQKLQILQELHSAEPRVRPSQPDNNQETPSPSKSESFEPRRNRPLGSSSSANANQLIPKRSNVNYSSQSEFVPPNYVLSDGILYDINGKQLETVKGRVINIDSNGEFTTLIGRQVNIVSIKNGKVFQELWGIEKDFNPTQWILIRGERTIVQHYASTVVFTSKTFTKEVFLNSQILALSRHFPNQLLFTSPNQYGTISLKDFSTKINRYPKVMEMRSVTASSMPDMFNEVALIAQDRYLYILDVRSGEVINSRDLSPFSMRFVLRNIKINLQKGIVFVWSMQSEYLLAFNTTSTNVAMDLIWAQKLCPSDQSRGLSTELHGYSYKFRSVGNSVYLLFTCGQTSSLFELPLPEQQNVNLIPKEFQYVAIVVAITGVVLYKTYSKNNSKKKKQVKATLHQKAN